MQLRASETSWQLRASGISWMRACLQPCENAGRKTPRKGRAKGRASREGNRDGSDGFLITMKAFIHLAKGLV